MWQTSIYNFEIIQGQSISFRFKFSDSSAAPINLTGWSVKSQIATGQGKLIKDMEASIDDAANGIVTVSLADEITATLPVQQYLWDLALEDTDGNVEKPLRGTVRVRQGATLPRSTS